MANDISLVQLGTDSDSVPSEAQAEETNTETNENVIRFPLLGERLDHFINRDGQVFAGTHLIVDLWGASRIDDLEYVEDTLREAVHEAGATLLHMHLHYFTENGGVSGVAVLAESHISIHTWPECGYAALDVFMCGDAEPYKAIDVLKRCFRPERVELGDHKRGIVG